VTSSNHFPLLWAEAHNYTDREAYVSDLALSSIWNDSPDTDIPQGRIDKIGRVWDCAHMSVKDICRAANLTQAGLAARFCIPKRTVEDWCRGIAKCAPYIRLMMCECLNLL